MLDNVYLTPYYDSHVAFDIWTVWGTRIITEALIQKLK